MYSQNHFVALLYKFLMLLSEALFSFTESSIFQQNVFGKVYANNKSVIV